MLELILIAYAAVTLKKTVIGDRGMTKNMCNQLAVLLPLKLLLCRRRVAIFKLTWVT